MKDSLKYIYSYISLAGIPVKLSVRCNQMKWKGWISVSCSEEWFCLWGILLRWSGCICAHRGKSSSKSIQMRFLWSPSSYDKTFLSWSQWPHSFERTAFCTSSGAPETRRINSSEPWGRSGGTYWLITLLRHLRAHYTCHCFPCKQECTPIVMLWLGWRCKCAMVLVCTHISIIYQHRSSDVPRLHRGRRCHSLKRLLKKIYFF